MKFLVSLLLLLQFNTVYSQHSNRFMNLIQDLKPTDTSNIENYYPNDTLKVKGTMLYYSMPEYNYSKKAGLWMEYYRNGELKTKSEYDKLGNLLNKSLYDLEGSISSEITATLIDSEVSNSKEYFLRNDEVSTVFRIKNYKFGAAVDKIYLREVGLVKGGKRIGVWKLYTQRGRLEKEINYDKK